MMAMPTVEERERAAREYREAVAAVLARNPPKAEVFVDRKEEGGSASQAAGAWALGGRLPPRGFGDPATGRAGRVEPGGVPLG